MERSRIMARTKYQTIISLIVLVFLATDNAENLTKIVRSICVVHDPNFIQNVSCWARPFNRTVSVANMRGNLTRVVNNAFINLELFKRSDIKFQPFLVNVTDNFCAYMERNRASKYLKMLSSIYLPYTNMNHTCPYFGYVFIKDLPLDANLNIPSLWPVGEYRLDVGIIGDEGRIVTIEFFLEIKEKPGHWLG